MELLTTDLASALEALDREAPGAPLLALGQTVFWDEPMKAGVALRAKGRRFVAGVHDTDYFAKLPGVGSRSGAKFKALPHNDTTTKALWSAAAEFSGLFGSETVVTRELYNRYGAHLDRVGKGAQGFVNESTEAWGWRGVVGLMEETPITADLRLEDVYPVLRETLQWAIDQSLNSISEPDRLLSQERASALLAMVDEKAASGGTLADLYEALLPEMARFASGSEVALDVTRTTELLRFNRATCCLPRFDLADFFVNPQTAALARDAYNAAVRGSEIYSLERFLSGATPFDVVVPGKGRGQLRLANRAIVIMTPEPIFVSLKKPLQSVGDLAGAIEDKLGPECALVGKAVTLIGMLAREFVFVFHRGASGYVHTTRKFHQNLTEKGMPLRMNPILRVGYSAWDAIKECRSWLHLPEPLHQPFGAEEICAPSLAARWREVEAEQNLILEELKLRNRPLDLILYLRDSVGASWSCLAREYEAIHDELANLERSLEALRTERRGNYGVLREAKQRRVRAEIAKGVHFRAEIFEKDPTEEALNERVRLSKAVEDAIHGVGETQQTIRDLMHRQRNLASAPEVLRAHERRRAIEREAELKRVRLIRSAVIATKGITAAGRRPAAWWFPIVCPDGGWFNATIESASCYLEPLQ